MKMLILAFGTRGDVQPFVALAGTLNRRGHDTVLAAPQRFAPLAAAHGVTFAPVDDGPLGLMNGTGGVGDTVTRGMRASIDLARALPAAMRPVLDDATAIATTGAGAGAELIVHNGQILAGPHLAEALDVPCVLALAIPLYVPTRAFPWPGQALPNRLPDRLNRATYLGMRGPAAMFARSIDAWRTADLGLPRRAGRHDPLRDHRGRPTPVLHAVSRHVLPPVTDWPDHVASTGFWFLPAATSLPDDLVAFLAAGPPPVLVGFGSMSGSDPAATTRVVLDAVDRAGVRAVLAAGWGGLRPHDGTDGHPSLPDHVHAVDQVPYDLLMPHLGAVVHHGGVGTTATATAAGIPQVVCPFVADQPFWGRRMHALGVAPPPLPQRHLAAASLGEAVRQAVTDPDLRRRATELGALIRDENGAVHAALRLESII